MGGDLAPYFVYVREIVINVKDTASNNENTNKGPYLTSTPLCTIVNWSDPTRAERTYFSNPPMDTYIDVRSGEKVKIQFGVKDPDTNYNELIA